MPIEPHSLAEAVRVKGQHTAYPDLAQLVYIALQRNNQAATKRSRIYSTYQSSSNRYKAQVCRLCRNLPDTRRDLLSSPLASLLYQRLPQQKSLSLLTLSR